MSEKTNTTVRETLGVFTRGDTQVLLFDTPGVVDAKYVPCFPLPCGTLTADAGAGDRAGAEAIDWDGALCTYLPRRRLHPKCLWPSCMLARRWLA